MPAPETGVQQKAAGKIDSLLTGVPKEMEYTGYTWTTDLGLGTEKLTFPIMTVNPHESKEKHVSIAYVNSSRPDFIRIGAEAITNVGFEIINQKQPDLVLAVTPPTDKSQGLSDAVVNSLREKIGANTRIETIVIPGGKDLVESGIIMNQQRIQDYPWGTSWQGVEVASGESVLGCSWIPITRKNKSLYFTRETLLKFFEAHQAANPLVINVDDLITSGATIFATESAEMRFANIDHSKIVIAAVAWETGSLSQLPPNWFYAALFKEWVGVF